jgi:phosphoribosyl 1,2-cyclic phosphate phosphodiesterase
MIPTQHKSPKMTLTFLGTGTSTGCPAIGCTCRTCTSNDPRDQRLRTSAYLEVDDLKLQIDIGPDFRQQMLRASIKHIDAVLLTHEHNDHIIGLDEIRSYNFLQKKPIPVYATEQVQHDLKRRFYYMFTNPSYPGVPKVDLLTISKEQPFKVKNILITPIEVLHGNLPVLGFRIYDFAYITDIKTISQEELNKVRGVKTLVLSTLHKDAHFSHLNIDEALQLINEIQPEKTYFTHISHHMGRYAEVNDNFPPNVNLAYDGLKINVL